MSQDSKRNSESIASKLIAAGFPADLDGLRFNVVSNVWEFTRVGPLTFAKRVKPTDEARQNDSVPTPDSELSGIALNANSAYHGLLLLFYQSESNADIKIRITMPTGADGNRVDRFWDSKGDRSALTSLQKNNPTDGNIEAMAWYFTVITDVTAGDMGFSWAQVTPQATFTTVFAGSMLIVWET